MSDVPGYLELTDEQDEVCNLPFDKNYLISGAPGTGKSVVALYRAQSLTFDDRAPLILMFNRVLMQYTSSHVGAVGVTGKVVTFHKWFRDFWVSSYGALPPKIGDGDWSYDWAGIAMRFVTEPPQRASEIDLIVDEGQDMPLGFYYVARWTCRTVTVFADENQQLRDGQTTLVEIERAIGADEHVVLRTNHRNSSEIARLAEWFYSGTPTDVPALPTRSHRPGPSLRNHLSFEALIEEFATYARRNPGLKIGVAVPTTRLQSTVFDKLVRRRIRASKYVWNDPGHRSLDFEKPDVKVLTYMSVKGLQFDTLFVPELHAIEKDVTSASVRMLFYVVLSRARNELYLSYRGSSEPPLVAPIPHGLLHRLG